MKTRIALIIAACWLGMATLAQEGGDTIWQPQPGTTWQLQLGGDVINTTWDVAMYDIDLFDSPPTIIDALHRDGRIVICYFSAGSWEEWREDANEFPVAVLGADLVGWEGERWLDIRRIDLLAPIMTARLDLAVQKGCDGVDPDNVNGYANDTGFDLTYADQLAYNIWLTEEAHQRGLSIGLKNDLEQIEDLVDYFDWALNEECFQYGECDYLLPFIEAGKAVFGVEYEGNSEDYCPEAIALGFSWLTKTYDLGDEPPGACVAEGDIAVARSDGAIRLTIPSVGASDQNPAFSPDSNQILFTRFYNGYNEGPSDILVLDYTSGVVESLISAEDCDNVNMPGTSWNVVTDRIVFSSDREDTDEIWTVDSGGNNLFRVTHTAPNYALEPTFSPDGEWIVFEIDTNAPDGGQVGAIGKIRANGTDLMLLTVGTGYDDRQPNWSPTGERILFQRREFGSDNWDIYTIALDGSDLRQITFHLSADTNASWSPDGQWIVYSSDYGDLELANLFIIAAEGGEPVRLTFNDAGYDGAPSWSPDGQWIVFESGGDESPTTLWMITIPPLP